MEPKKKPIDLAIIFGGKGKGGSKSPSRGSDDHEDESAEEDHEDLPPGFEAAAIEAFPDLDGDHDRLLAFKRAVAACSGSYDE